MASQRAILPRGGLSPWNICKMLGFGEELLPSPIQIAMLLSYRVNTLHVDAAVEDAMEMDLHNFSILHSAESTLRKYISWLVYFHFLAIGALYLH